MADAFTTSRDKSRWDWTLMIMVPDWIDEDLLATAAQQAGATNRPDRLDKVRLEAPFTILHQPVRATEE